MNECNYSFQHDTFCCLSYSIAPKIWLNVEYKIYASNDDDEWKMNPKQLNPFM